MKIRFNYREFLFGVVAFFLMIPFFKPNYIYVKMPGLNTIFLYYLYGAIGFIFLYYISVLIINKKMFSPIIIMVSFYAATLVISSFLNDGFLMSAVFEGLSYIAIFMLSELLLIRSLNLFLNVVTPILNLLVIINFFTLIIWPNGMYRSFVGSSELWNSGTNWFLGYDNAFFAYVLPTLLFSLIKYLYVNKTFLSKTKALVMIGVCTYTIISRWSATAVVGIIIFLFVFVLIQMNKLPAIANAQTYILGNVMVFLGFVVLRVQDKFAYIIKNLLGKDLTFTGRTEIWDLSLKSIYQSPVFGYGIEDLYKTIQRISSHNQYLWILYRGGLVHFLPFIVMVLSIGKRLYEKRDVAYVKITAIALCTIFIMWQFEAITTHSIMLLFVFSYYVGYAKLKTKEDNYRENNSLVAP